MCLNNIYRVDVLNIFMSALFASISTFTSNTKPVHLKKKIKFTCMFTLHTYEFGQAVQREDSFGNTFFKHIRLFIPPSRPVQLY